MVGDRVLSRDPQTGKDEAKTVTATIERHAPSVVDVVLHDAKTSKAETLTCTPEHPLYVQGQGWVEAGSLGIGTSIVSRAGPALQVTDLTWETNKAQELAAGSAGSTLGGYTVYNLTVEDDHTFFVGAANGGTWVHNVDCVTLEVSKSRWPESAAHIEEAQEAGRPAELTIERGNAAKNRAESLKGIPSDSLTDRDEYPPAMFREGGAGSSIRNINPSDNRGAGAYIGGSLRGFPNGTIVRLEPVP